MKKILLDCGFYDGVAIEQYLKAGVIDDNWTIYTWEPMPDLDINLRLERIPLKITVFKEAAWIADTEVPFAVNARESANYVIGTRGDSLAGGELVPAIDFSAFVAQLPRDAYIICTMDIEGSEYAVLEKMLEDNTIDQINLLDVEFHHRLMGNKTPEDSKVLIEQILNRGTGVRLRIPLE